MRARARIHTHTHTPTLWGKLMACFSVNVINRVVFLIIITIHFLVAKDNGHVLQNEAYRCFASSGTPLAQGAIHKQGNQRFMTIFDRQSDYLRTHS